MILLVSGLIIFFAIGGLSLLACYYTQNGIKSKNVGDGQHDTAWFATKNEIEETYAEVPINWRNGKTCLLHRDLWWGHGKAGKLYALADTRDVHCLMIDAVGVSKTAHFLYPNIKYSCTCGMSFPTTDTKDDIHRYYVGIAKKCYRYHIAVILLITECSQKVKRHIVSVFKLI